MGLYSKAIRKKEEDNQKYEQYADESLLNDKAMLKLEEGVDDAQTTVLYILGKFGIQMDRLYGLRNVDEMLEMMLDPRWKSSCPDPDDDRLPVFLSA